MATWRAAFAPDGRWPSAGAFIGRWSDLRRAEGKSQPAAHAIDQRKETRIEHTPHRLARHGTWHSTVDQPTLLSPLPRPDSPANPPLPSPGPRGVRTTSAGAPLSVVPREVLLGPLDPDERSLWLLPAPDKLVLFLGFAPPPLRGLAPRLKSLTPFASASPAAGLLSP